MENQQPNSLGQQMPVSAPGNEHKSFAAMSYVSALCLVSLFAKKDDEFVQFHAKQGLVLFIAEVVLSFINVIPGIGYGIWRIVSLVLFIVAVLGMVNAWKGRYWKLPLLSEYAKQIKL